MNSPLYFEVMDQYAAYEPVGEVSFDEALRLVTEAIIYARENSIRRLLVDTTQLTGFGPPSTTERFSMGETFAREGQSKVVLALIARPEMIDENRFGMIVARNRWLHCDVFQSKAEAIAWLTEQAMA